MDGTQNEVPQFVFAVTLMYLGSTFLLTRFIRFFLRQSSNKTLHVIADDTLSTFQAIACSLENFATKRTYGYPAFGIQLFTLSTWHGLTMMGCGNPCGNIFRMLRGKQSRRLTGLKIVLQLIGGVIAWCYAKSVWSIGLSLPHSARYSVVNCQTDLNTEIWKGCLLEMGGAIFLTVAVRIKSIPLVVFAALDALVTIIGVHLSGMYYNPANAFVQTFGCQGATYLQFLIVYWVSPFVGCYLATVVDGYRKTMGKGKQKKKVKIP